MIFFINTASDITKSVDTSGDPMTTFEYVANSNLFLISTTPEEISRSITQLKHTAAGYNKISTEILQACSREISNAISQL